MSSLRQTIFGVGMRSIASALTHLSLSTLFWSTSNTPYRKYYVYQQNLLSGDTMFENLPSDYTVALDWGWQDWEPYFTALSDSELSADTVETWLHNRDTVGRLMWEVGARIRVATTVDTNDEIAENRLKKFMGEVNQNAQKVNFMLDKKLVESGLAPEELRIPLRNVEASIKLYREENLPLISQL